MEECSAVRPEQQDVAQVVLQLRQQHYARTAGNDTPPRCVRISSTFWRCPAPVAAARATKASRASRWCCGSATRVSGFFLVSYRRSGAASNPGCALPALPVDGSTDNEEVSASEIRSASRIVQQQAQQQHRLQLQLRQHHQQQQLRQLQQYTVDTAQGHIPHSAAD